MSTEVGRTHIVDVESGATVPPEGHQLYARDTDKLFKSDGTTLTEIAGGGGGLDIEGAQDAVGAMVDSTLVYTDGTPLLSRAALTGDVTASAGSNATTITNDAVTDSKLRNSAALSVIGRSANSTGDPADIAGATVNHVLQVGAGPVLSWGYHRSPSVNNPPANTHAYSDEFDSGSLDAKWTAVSAGTTNPVASGTVVRINNLTTPIHDAATMPSYMLFQSDNSSAATFGLKQTVTVPSNCTIFVKMFADNKVFNAANEGAIMLRLFNAADTNEYVEVGLANNTGAGQTTRAALSNNGTMTLNFNGSVRTEGNPLIESLFCIMKSTNTYHFFSGTEGTPLLTRIGTATKTVVTTFDTLQINCYTANETPSTIYGVDFVRWYDSLETNLVNR